MDHPEEIIGFEIGPESRVKNGENTQKKEYGWEE
jgi:hypothetical protein